MATQPEYDQFVAEAREAVAQAMAVTNRWQDQGRVFLENTGTEGADVRAGEQYLSE
jgi:hypothetical protein